MAAQHAGEGVAGEHGATIFAVKPGDGSAREQAASCQKVLGGWANIANEYATKIEKVTGTQKEFLVGTWINGAKKLAKNSDDFTKELYELNARSLITTWGSYESLCALFSINAPHTEQCTCHLIAPDPI